MKIRSISRTKYDLLGRMRSISNEAGGRYRYDSRSLRVKSQLRGTGRAHIYSLSGQLIEEVDGVLNKWIADYVYLNGRLLAKLTPMSVVIGGGESDIKMSVSALGVLESSIVSRVIGNFYLSTESSCIAVMIPLSSICH
jgi:hypothetical protein